MPAILNTVVSADDIQEAAEFETIEEAEEKRDYLEEAYPYYTWYVLIKN